MNKHNTPPVNTFDQSQDKDILFSYFNGRITNTTPSGNVNLHEVYSLIKSEVFAGPTAALRNIKDIKAAKNFKSNNFDYVTFAGSFSIRNDASLIKASGLFVIDIDHVGERLQELRQRIIDDKILCPQLVFISPSGDGLKTVISIDASLIDYSADSRKVNDIWQAVNSYFSKHYSDILIPSKNDFIDPANKEISRPCFLCHDASVYLNENENVTVNSEFIKEFPALMTPSKPSVKKAADQGNRGTASPSIPFESLAKKHLKESDNHHPELLSFIGAAKGIGKPADQTLNYIVNNVKIAPESSRNSVEMVQELVNDIYNRYGTDSEGIVYLNPLSFAYSFMYFNFQGKAGYVFSNLFQTEVRNVLHRAGYYKRLIGKDFISIQKNGCIIKEVSLENIKDYMTKIIDDIKEDICFTYQDNYYQICPAIIKETYLKNSHNIFNKNWLQHLQEFTDPEIKDTESESYFYFNNAFVTVSKEDIRHEQWDEKKGFCIWEDQIIKHDFDIVEDYSESHFFNFLLNVTNEDENRMKTMMTGIGYLLHHHFKASEGQAVLFYDESITDLKTPQGGSGKGLIVKAIKEVRNVTKIDGKHLANDSKFKWEQVSPSTQVVWLDDVKPDFDFSILHSNLTDGWTIERKNVSQFIIHPKDSPKTVICSNSIVKGEGSTNIRRQFIIELSDFYSKKIKKGDEKPIEAHHGGLMFGAHWSKNEWDMFFSFMLNCSKAYFNNGLNAFEGINIKRNRFRQATNEDFVQWCEDKGFQLGIDYHTKIQYESFINLYYGDSHKIGQRTFTSWIKDYANFKQWEYNSRPSNGTTLFLFSEKSV